jgi:GH25 family lysozyme M1 (1,4-beta-N-acetylmuramidase)
MTIQRKGIDVSVYQGIINWEKVKATGVEFAILRAGYGKVLSQKDAQFENNYQGCKTSGIPCGAYWYSYATGANDAQLEAETFLKVINGKSFEYPVVFDIEEARCQAKASEICETFCSILEKAGYFVTIYASKAFLDSYISKAVRDKYDIWVAQWGSKCTYSGNFGMWQYSGDPQNARISGINGVVDLNWAYKDYPSIIRGNGLNGFKAIVANSPAKPEIADVPNEPEKHEIPDFTDKSKPQNPYPVPSENIRKGDRGDGVKWIQFELNRHGSKLVIDGIFGNNTNAEVINFQQNKGLAVDGIVGVLTRERLGI